MSGPGRHRSWVLAALAVAAHLGALAGTFQFDDYNVIVGQPAVHGFGAWWASLPAIRPVLKASYALCWGLGPGPAPFHLLNLAIHAGNAVLAHRLLLRALGPARAGAAFAAALGFALHPAATEVVAYVSGRSESLMALFYLGGLLAFLRARERGGGLAREAPAGLLLVLACLTKEIAVTLPLALALWSAAFPGTAGRARLRLPWPLAAAALLVLAAGGLHRLLAAGAGVRGAGAQFLGQVQALAHLLRIFVWPAGLDIDPALRAAGTWSPATVLEAALLAGLLALGAWLLRRRPAAGFGLLWFFLLLLPAHSLVPRLDLVNDRHLYLPGLGLWLALAALVPDAWLTRSRLLPAAAALALVLGTLTVRRTRDYRSQRALWTASLAVNPDNPRAHTNLGWALYLEGDRTGAREQFREALRLDPGQAQARANLALLD